MEICADIAVEFALYHVDFSFEQFPKRFHFAEMTKELLNRQLRIARTFRADIKAKCAAFEDDFRRIKRTKSVLLKIFPP